MENHTKILAFMIILMISTLACSLTGSADPASAIQTLIPDEAQTMVASGAQTLIASVVPLTATETAEPGIDPGNVFSANGDCGNILYPVVDGATWNYDVNSNIPTTFTRSISTLTPEGFTDQDIFASGTIRTGQWTCDSGALTALDPGSVTGTDNSANIQTTGLFAEFQTTSMDGVTLPAVVTSGTSWAQNVTLEGTQNIAGQDVYSKSTSTYNCTATGNESVTVPAGTFTAMRVECQTNITITVTMAGVEIPTNITFNSTIWYAPGVGMVKTDSLLSDGTSSSTLLTDYNIP